MEVKKQVYKGIEFTVHESQESLLLYFHVQSFQKLRFRNSTTSSCWCKVLLARRDIGLAWLDLVARVVIGVTTHLQIVQEKLCQVLTSWKSVL